jgi:hypothetical protein
MPVSLFDNKPVLALAAATAVGTSHTDSRAWAEVAGTRL